MDTQVMNIVEYNKQVKLKLMEELIKEVWEERIVIDGIGCQVNFTTFNTTTPKNTLWTKDMDKLFE